MGNRRRCIRAVGIQLPLPSRNSLNNSECFINTQQSAVSANVYHPQILVRWKIAPRRAALLPGEPFLIYAKIRAVLCSQENASPPGISLIRLMVQTMRLFEFFFLCLSFIMRWLVRLSWVIALAGIVFSTIVVIYYQQVEDELPNVEKLKEVRYETPLQIYSSDGKLIGVFGQIKREPASIDEIPDLLQKAFISIEDERFYDHSGFDLKSIARAAMAIAHSGRISQGASTITQQVARNFFLSNEKTVERKIKEIFIAIHIEKVLTKKQILELYLNKVWLGHQAYGVKAAAHLYFNKELRDLTLGEMAILAGMPKGPSDYNPISHPDKSRQRRDVVLDKMFELGHITHEQYIAARDEPITASFNGPKIEFSAGYASEMARLFALEQFGEEEAYNRGLRIYTTIDSKVQAAADMAVFNGVMAYDRRHGYRKDDVVRLWGKKETPWDESRIAAHLSKMKTYSLLSPAAVLKVSGKEASIMLKDGSKAALGWDGIKWARSYISYNRQGVAPDSAGKVLSAGDIIWVYEKTEVPEGKAGKKEEPRKVLMLAQLPKINSALISLRPDDGQIVAVVGGYSYDASKFNRATQAHRQPGSNFKPFIYSSALRHGFTLATIVNDSPLSLPAGGGKIWSPKNSPNTYAGPIPLREALALSKNVVSVRLLLSVGLSKVAEHVERFGFKVTDLYRHPTLALGAIDITPFELLRGYSAMANGGFLINPYLVERIEDEEGNILYQAEPEVACRSCTDAQGTEDDKRKRDPRLDALYQLPDGLDDNEPLPGEIPDAKKKPAEQLPPPETYAGSKRAKQIISHANAFLTAQAMHSVIYGAAERGLPGFHGTGWRAKRDMPKRNDLYGKTGTTNDSRDCWFSGFNSKIATSVYIGFDDHTPLGHSWAGYEAGAQSAQPIWNEFMAAVLEGTPDSPIPAPSNVSLQKVDQNGKLSDAGGRTEYIEDDTGEIYTPLDNETEEDSFFDSFSTDDTGSEFDIPDGSQQPDDTAPGSTGSSERRDTAPSTDDIF